MLADADAKRIEEQTEHLELIGGIIAATMANYSFATPKTPLAPADFMPSQRSKKKKPAGPDRDAIAQKIRCFLKAQAQARNPNADHH